MANTTNFGWETPDDTDLVKDGALAMRTLGNAIDTSLVDLKGGTTGQVLSKNTNTDMDFVWSTPNVGDITEVQAGTGISVASGTGPIPVVTNTVATTFDAKGDLVAGTGADTFAKLTVGANNTVLTADSSTATGLKWAASVSGGMTSLATGTLSGSSVALNSISGTYTNLELHISGFNVAGSRLYLRINGDTGSNYTGGYVRQRNGVGSVAQYANSPGQNTEIRSDGEVTPDSGATNTVIFRFPNYTASAGAKVIESIAYSLSSTFLVPAYSWWGYTGTAGAITSLTILSSSANFSAGTYTLWGIK